MTYQEHILEIVKGEEERLSKAKPGGPNSREKSWEYCHKAFLDLHKKNFADLTDADYDYLALHLAFYLASWGMYRGSSFLLKRDYKTHIPAVKLIMEPKYDMLWDFDPAKQNANEVDLLLFGRTKEKDANCLFEKLNNSYGEDKPTDTLITKILLGTFACIPAFDTFFKESCAAITPKIEQNPKNAFRELCDFAIKYREELRFSNGDVYCPPMKALDFYFWEVAFSNQDEKHMNSFPIDTTW